MKLKFNSILNGNLVQSLCIKYNWRTGMTNEEFNDMLETVQTKECESAIQDIALRIHAYSNTPMTVNAIAGELFRNAVTRFVSREY